MSQSRGRPARLFGADRVVPYSVLLTTKTPKPTGQTVGEEDAMGTVASLLADHVSFR